MSAPQRLPAQASTPVSVGASPEAALHALWRARALRYLLIYLLLACMLVTLRFQTRHISPDVRTLRDERTALQHTRDELSVAVQTATGEQRIREWAIRHDMLPYAQASKQTRPLTAGPPNRAAPTPAALNALPTRLEVTTRWK